jgi:hypothetical protein
MTAEGYVFPLCPFSRSRIDATMCPGYAPRPLSTAPLWPASHELLPAEACDHLRSEQRTRGYVPTCGRPTGLPLTQAAFAELRRAGRQSMPGTGSGVGGSVE